MTGHHSNFITRHGDYSYGLYLYGYIIQNILFYYGIHMMGLVIFMMTSILFTAPFAIISWNFVEVKALKLKNPALAGSFILTNLYFYFRRTTRRETSPVAELTLMK